MYSRLPFSIRQNVIKYVFFRCSTKKVLHYSHAHTHLRYAIFVEMQSVFIRIFKLLYHYSINSVLNKHVKRKTLNKMFQIFGRMEETFFFEFPTMQSITTSIIYLENCQQFVLH